MLSPTNFPLPTRAKIVLSLFKCSKTMLANKAKQQEKKKKERKSKDMKSITDLIWRQPDW